MKKRVISLIILIILISMPSIVLADRINSIIIVVDEMSLNMVQQLSNENSNIGLMNLKTRDIYSEENLYLSINKGRKLGKKDLQKEENTQWLGDILKEEKTSYIGMGNEAIILWDSNRKVDYETKTILYDIDWLLKNTDNILEQSNILVIGYDFENKLDRVNTLNQYLEYYKEEQIIILPKAISEEDEKLLNKSLVPIIHMNKEGGGLLSSSSTKREGFIAIEDIAVQLKNTYGHYNKADIGNGFQTIEKEDAIKEIHHIYRSTMNLLIITYIFHGFIYLSQVLLGIWILKSNKLNRGIYFLYIFSTINIFISLILGFFQMHRNIFIYLLVITIVSYILSRRASMKEDKSLEILIISTYGLIVLGILIYPKMIYNSYIGFNNLVYGARYYGFNNGIMGVLLSSSILSFFIMTREIRNIVFKKIIGFCIFGLNMLALSTNFGANTGGFITSVILFILMMYMTLFSEKHSFKKIIMFLLIGIFLFTVNMIVDNKSGDQSHAIEFFYRLKENGFKELSYMISFKLRELILLTLSPPFSIVLIFQGIILKNFSKDFIQDKEIKKVAKAILVTSLVGFIINDTGMIMLIYMLNYFILYIISNKRSLE